MDQTSWLWALLGGSVSGATVAVIAKALLPGKQAVGGPALLLIGTGAGFLGGLVGGLIGIDDGEGIEWGQLAISVAFAAVAIVFWIRWRNEKMKNLLVPGPPGAGQDAMKKSQEALENPSAAIGHAAGNDTKASASGSAASQAKSAVPGQPANKPKAKGR